MNKKFSELEDADTLTGSELLAVSQKNDERWNSKKITVNKLKKIIPPGFSQQLTLSEAFNSSAPDDLSQAEAHGKFSGGEYWKTGWSIDDGSLYTPWHCRLTDIPCDSDGNMLHYNLYTSFSSVSNWRAIKIVLTVFGDTAQFLNVETGIYRKSGRDSNLVLWYALPFG